ncbi:hypothetical protein FQA39_LY06132 [Lamprigera yunnana]|nr:hypothetical protein FQA39_LY06132 [Lamprigera yunnana]
MDSETKHSKKIVKYPTNNVELFRVLDELQSEDEDKLDGYDDLIIDRIEDDQFTEDITAEEQMPQMFQDNGVSIKEAQQQVKVVMQCVIAILSHSSTMCQSAHGALWLPQLVNTQKLLCENKNGDNSTTTDFQHQADMIKLIVNYSFQGIGRIPNRINKYLPIFL